MPGQHGGYGVVAVDLVPGDWAWDKHGGYEVSAVNPAQVLVQVLGTDGNARRYDWNEILAHRPGRSARRNGPLRRFGDVSDRLGL